MVTTLNIILYYKEKLVVFFYPSKSPGCTAEAALGIFVVKREVMVYSELSAIRKKGNLFKT